MGLYAAESSCALPASWQEEVFDSFSSITNQICLFRNISSDSEKGTVTVCELKQTNLAARLS